MKGHQVILVLAIAAVCIPSASLAKKYPTCAGGNYPSANPERFDYTLIADYGNGHAQHKLSIELKDAVTSWHVMLCFDSPVCVTEVWNGHMDPFFRLGCAVVMSENIVHLSAGDKISFTFNTFSRQHPAGSVVPSTVDFNGNSLLPITVINPPPIPSQVYCEYCDGGYNPSSISCNQFIQCSNTVPHTMHCPATLEFNPWNNVCDYPRNTGCKRPIRRHIYCLLFVGNCPSDHFVETVEIAGC